MKLYKKGEPVLTKIATPVDTSKLGNNIITLVGKMNDVMLEEGGVGLAAPQIGVSKRVIVVDTSRDPVTPFYGAMINPTITYREGVQTSQEGCLSLPGQWYEVERANKITVEYTTIMGERKIRDLEGPTAAVVQHELDHLDGKLICDIGEPINDPRKG